MFLSELIDLRIRESPTYAPPFSFRLNLPYSDPLLKPNPDGHRHSVTTLLQKPVAGPASIVQNGPARSQITIRDAEVKRAEIGRIRRLHVKMVRQMLRRIDTSYGGTRWRETPQPPRNKPWERVYQMRTLLGSGCRIGNLRRPSTNAWVSARTFGTSSATRRKISR